MAHAVLRQPATVPRPLAPRLQCPVVTVIEHSVAPGRDGVEQNAMTYTLIISMESMMMSLGRAQKVERLRGSLHCIGAPAQARHTVFVDGEAEAAAFRPDEYFDTPAELVSRTFNRPRRRAPRKPDTAGHAL